MKIFLYSDLHISKTSSILPLTYDSKYSYRQHMIMELGKYLTDIIDEYKPDLIINLGDTFDQHTLTSYDINVASEFFKCFRLFNIPHLVLVGNHEMVNTEYNAIELLNNISNITVISEPCTVHTASIVESKENNIDLAFLPYCNFKDIIDFPKGDYMFSHQDIQGSKLRGDFVLPQGISKEQLKDYKLVFNGHIHKPSIENNIINVGSISTHSFSDDDVAVPQCYLFDTNTLDLQIFKPKMCPLFRKCNINNLDELQEYVTQLDNTYMYILQCTCPFEIKDNVKQYLTNCKLILNYKLNIKFNEYKVTDEGRPNIEVQTNLDIVKAFTDFLETVDLKYPRSLYTDILKGVE